MSDDKQELEEELEMHFDDVEELEELYEEEDFGSFEDLGVEAAPAAVADSAQSARRWLILGFVGLVLAIMFRIFMSQVIDAHYERSVAAEEVSKLVDLTNSSAAQALTADGGFDSVSQSLADLEADVNLLTSPPGFFEKRASAFFSDPATVVNLEESWQRYQQSTTALMANREQVNRVKQVLAETGNELSDTVTETIAFVEAVAKEGRSKRSDAAKDRYLFLTSEAANINGILSRLSSGLRGYTLPNVDLQKLSDTQNTLVVRLKDTLGRITGNSAAVVATAAEPLQARFNSIETKLLELGDNAQAVTESRTAVQQMNARGDSVANLASEAVTNNKVQIIEVLSNAVPLIFLLIGLFSIWRFFKLQSRDLVQSEGSLSDALADQQESILKLLDEMSALADGDLTVEAEVTDQITGAIADSVNFAVIEMRELVSQINRASVEVANESEQAVTNAQSVSASNKSQAEQVRFAAAEMQRITQSMREMSDQALSSSEMATESRNAAAQGTQAVRETIAGMDNMREQIQDTSKRIKRLGESSQRIGDIVALIDDIAEQTNILSLNAAIQASMAGEAGRGFAVVSDEVQSLAERSTEATKKIAELVSTIQNDTNDAVASMEKATQQVISGTRVADSAGTALAEIEKASNQLSELVELIAKQSSEQARNVTEVAERVTIVSDSSTETSAKAQESANSIAKLLELAKELETSVSRFKLPAS